MMKSSVVDGCQVYNWRDCADLQSCCTITALSHCLLTAHSGTVFVTLTESLEVLGPKVHHTERPKHFKKRIWDISLITNESLTVWPWVLKSIKVATSVRKACSYRELMKWLWISAKHSCDVDDEKRGSDNKADVVLLMSSRKFSTWMF